MLNRAEVQNCKSPGVSDLHLKQVRKKTGHVPILAARAFLHGHHSWLGTKGAIPSANGTVTTGSADKDSEGSLALGCGVI